MVGRTARRHKLFSEAAKRWERGVDPALALVALERAVRLLTEHGGGTAERGGARHRPRPAATPGHLPADLPARLVGVEYPPARVVDLLERVGCTVAQGATGCPRTRARSAWPAASGRAEGDPADLAARPDRPGRPGRGGGPARRVRQDASVLPIAPPGSGLTAAQRRRRAVGRRWPRRGYVEVLELPVRRRRSWPTRSACRPTTRAGPRCGWPTRCPRRSRCCAPRCSAAARQRCAQPRPGSPRPRAVRDRPGLPPARRRRQPAGDGRGPAPHRRRVRGRRRGGAAPAVARRRGARRRRRAGRLVGRRAGRPAGRTRSRPARTCWPPPGSADERVEVRAAEYAPWHPGRCAELRGRRRRSSGTPASCTRRSCAALELPRRTCAMELDLDALPLPR